MAVFVNRSAAKEVRRILGAKEPEPA